jgi:hypothetical protein
MPPPPPPYTTPGDPVFGKFSIALASAPIDALPSWEYQGPFEEFLAQGEGKSINRETQPPTEFEGASSSVCVCVCVCVRACVWEIVCV